MEFIMNKNTLFFMLLLLPGINYGKITTAKQITARRLPQIFTLIEQQNQEDRTIQEEIKKLTAIYPFKYMSP